MTEVSRVLNYNKLDLMINLKGALLIMITAAAASECPCPDCCQQPILIPYDAVEQVIEDSPSLYHSGNYYDKDYYFPGDD